jgi:hypothetical protein
MKTTLITGAIVALLVVLSVVQPSAAIFGSTKVYVFAAAEGADTFQAVPRALLDSVHDLRGVLAGGGLRETSHRDQARIIVQVMSREEVQGEMRVHVHVTADGHAADLTGTSVHQWKQAAIDLADQLSDWVKAHPAK